LGYRPIIIGAPKMEIDKNKEKIFIFITDSVDIKLILICIPSFYCVKWKRVSDFAALQSDLPQDILSFKLLCVANGVSEMQVLAEEVSTRLGASVNGLALQHGWKRQVAAWFSDDPSAGLKATLKDALERRLEDVLLRPIQYAGNRFSTDPRSIEMMQGVISRVERTGTLPTGWVGWRSETNQLHWGASSPDDVAFHLQGILNALGDRTQALYAFVWGKKAEIDAMDVMSLATPPKPIENPLEIDVTNGFDLFEGWPS